MFRRPSRLSELRSLTLIGNNSSPYLFIVSNRPFLGAIIINSLNGRRGELDLLREEHVRGNPNATFIRNVRCCAEVR